MSRIGQVETEEAYIVRVAAEHAYRRQIADIYIRDQRIKSLEDEVAELQRRLVLADATRAA